MKLTFEDWLTNQKISEDAKGILEESIRCYKNSAYRASLLFSFLGLQIILKERILNANRAEGYEELEWQQRQKELRDYEIWEMKLTNVMLSKKTPFKMTEDLKRQYIYWKDRRNDCAHSKGNLISYPHVENFWLFFQSNLSKFVINGGLQSILQDISIYLNASLTPAHADMTPIIQKIATSLDQEEYNDFLNEFLKLSPNENTVTINSKIFNLWSALFSIEERRDTLVDFFLAENDRISFILKLIRIEPELIKNFKYKPRFIRYLWKEKFQKDNDYVVFIELLRNNMIPNEEVNEIYNQMFDEVNSTFFETDEVEADLYGIKVIEDVDIQLLINNNFFKEFYKQAIEARKIIRDFHWGNRNKELFLFYLKKFSIDKETVLILNRILEIQYPPKKLKELLYTFYEKNPDVQEKHEKVCEENDISLHKVFRKKEEHSN